MWCMSTLWLLTSTVVDAALLYIQLGYHGRRSEPTSLSGRPEREGGSDHGRQCWHRLRDGQGAGHDGSAHYYRVQVGGASSSGKLSSRPFVLNSFFTAVIYLRNYYWIMFGSLVSRSARIYTIYRMQAI